MVAESRTTAWRFLVAAESRTSSWRFLVVAQSLQPRQQQQRLGDRIRKIAFSSLRPHQEIPAAQAGGGQGRIGRGRLAQWQHRVPQSREDRTGQSRTARSNVTQERT